MIDEDPYKKILSKLDNEELEIILSPIRSAIILMVFRSLKIQEAETTTDLTISSLVEMINKHKRYDYKAIYKHLKILEKANILLLKQDKKQQGKPVYVVPSANARFPKLIKALMDIYFPQNTKENGN